MTERLHLFLAVLALVCAACLCRLAVAAPLPGDPSYDPSNAVIFTEEP